MRLFKRYQDAYYKVMENFNLKEIQERTRNNPLVLDKENIWKTKGK